MADKKTETSEQTGSKLADTSKTGDADVKPVTEVDEVELRSNTPELDGAHYYDAPDVRVPEVVVHEERGAQIVSVTVDEVLAPDDEKAFQVPRESLGSLGLPLHNLSLGTPQQQFDAAEADSDKE